MQSIINLVVINPLDIEQIVKEATFLSEHVENIQSQEDQVPINEQKATQHLNHWCNVVTRGNWEKFQQRLNWEGWNIEQVRQSLASVPIIDRYALPTWATTLTEIIQTIPVILSEPIALSSLQPYDSFPFEDILLPLVLVARRKLVARWGLGSFSPDTFPFTCLTTSAYLSLESALLRRLFNLTASTLEFEFSQIRTVGENLLNLVLDKGSSSRVKYNRFVKQVLSDGLLGFFQKYPVLGRLIATAINFWVTATGEFLERLNADLPEIQQVFGALASDLGKIINIETSLSDAHHEGRSVIALTFESKLKLIYKPKDLSLETVFIQLLHWCNQRLIQEKLKDIKEPFIPFKVLKILNRKIYGWVEYVEHCACQDEIAAQHYHVRAGMLLCLLYLLGSTDCHYENLIASGEHPVLVDMETVIHHEAKLMETLSAKTANLIAKDYMMDSVLRTGLLPVWQFGSDRSIAYDLSAFGSVEAQSTPDPVPVWRFINTDNMHKGYEIIDRPLQANVPTLNGVTLSPNTYLRELVSGFEQMYRFLVSQRDTLLNPDSPLAAFQIEQARFIFRHTRIYSRILQTLTKPEFLRDGMTWGIQLDVLSRAFLITPEKPQNWAILSAELRSLEQIDIPYFTATVGSDTLNLKDGRSIAYYFKAPSYQQILDRLKKFSEADLVQQVGIIQLVFHARVARSLTIQSEHQSITAADDASGKSLTRESLTRESLTCEQWLQQAEEIAAEIQQQAICGTDSSLTWIGLTYFPDIERCQFQPLGMTFYDGTGGIALFLAALAQVTGNSQFGDFALRALLPIRQFFLSADQDYVREITQELGIGGASGIGSIVYSLVKISQFLNMPALDEDALRIAKLITPEMIATDQKCDIIGGAAGAVLGLLALHQHTRESDALQTAIDCGQHLLRYCESAYSSQSRTASVKPLSGFSHGAAGIAYSLLQLYAITQNEAYLAAAQQAIVYESQVLSTTEGNWSIVSSVSNPSAAPVFWSTWCYGAPGIGLGRLAGLPIYQTEVILTDIDVALATTQKTGLQEIDHLCCGNLGRAEVLLVAGQKLANSRWSQAAYELATQVVQRASQTGHYQLFSGLPTPVFSPCFFQGMAGIGYQLLRFAYPQLPSVLLWN